MSVDAERPAPLMHAWRHPAPKGAAGRCIGARTDLPVDRRKAAQLKPAYMAVLKGRV